jgi:hypothetical protein
LSAPSRSVKKEEPEEEEWEQLPPELHEETRPWWVEHRELQATLSRHPDDPKDAPGHTLAVAHSLAAAKSVDLSSDNDEDVKPLVKKGRGGGDSSSGRYGGDIGY